jgi:glucose-1-phosphate adenylyltransferase
MGTADAVQQNFRFIKNGDPEDVLILSGDHIYQLNYDAMLAFHRDHGADLTIASIRVPLMEASRYGILDVGDDFRVKSFIEKPPAPPSNLANMGVYIFNFKVLDNILWEDRESPGSSHDFGKDIIPRMIADRKRVFAFPFSGYWVDVGTIHSYWQSHMDLLVTTPPINLNDRSWIVHTRTEERPPAWLSRNSTVLDSMITHGCLLGGGAYVERSVLSPGVQIQDGATVRESIILTDAIIERGAVIERAIIDKRVVIGANTRIGGRVEGEAGITMVGKNSVVPANYTVEPGAIIATDVIPSDYTSQLIRGDEFIQTKQLPYEV